MRRKIIGKRITAVVTSLALFGTMLPNLTLERKVQAAEQARSVSLGVSQIADPSGPQEGKFWDGDYVYYGTYQNDPIKWRVLDTTGNAGSSSAVGGILLQSDQVLANMPFDDVRAWLDKFRTTNFSKQEQAEIMKTTAQAGTSPSDLLRSAGLTGEEIFLLDAADLANQSYGYEYKDGAANSGIRAEWWLRSTYPEEEYADLMVGSVLSGGMLYPSFVRMNNGVVPAFNLDPSDVLFVTAANENKNALQAVGTTETNAWKLTLSEGDTLQVDNAGATRPVSSDSITVPYEYTGDTADQMSIMITNGTWNSGTEVKYYGTVSAQNGTVTFTLPGDFNENSDSVYLLAEQINGANKTDYASNPVKLNIPPRHDHKLEWSDGDEEAHWKVCTAANCPVENIYEDGYDDDEWGDGDDEENDDEYDDEYYEWAEEFFQWGYHDFGDNEENEDGEILCNICGKYISQPDDDDDDDDGYGDDDDDDDDYGDDDDDGDDGEHDPMWSVEVVQEATCTQEGLALYRCTYYDDDEDDYDEDDDDDDADEGCDIHQSYTAPIPALSPTLTHTFGEWVTITEPTTEKEGVAERICSVCKASERKAIDKLPPVHKHTYNILKADATYHWYECEADGEKNELEAHTWNAGKVLNEPSKELEGEIQYRCTVCNVTVNRTMAKIGTEFSSGIYQYRVTAGKEGSPTATLLGFIKGKSAKTVNVAKTVPLQGVKYSVTKIGKKAFYKNKKIQKVVIGDNVEKIGNLAFFSNKNLKNVTIGTGMKKLGEHTFCHTRQLESFVVKSKKLKKLDLSILHGNKKNIVIKVPAKKVKAYQKNIFFSHKECVKALKK